MISEKEPFQPPLLTNHFNNYYRQFTCFVKTTMRMWWPVLLRFGGVKCFSKRRSTFFRIIVCASFDRIYIKYRRMRSKYLARPTFYWIVDSLFYLEGTTKKDLIGQWQTQKSDPLIREKKWTQTGMNLRTQFFTWYQYRYVDIYCAGQI